MTTEWTFPAAEPRARIGRVSRGSDYSGADVDAAAALLRDRGTDPETVSLPCALAVLAASLITAGAADAEAGVLPPASLEALQRQAALHADCDGTRDAPRQAGTDAAPCLCPVCAAEPRPAHGAMVRAAKARAAQARAAKPADDVT